MNTQFDPESIYMPRELMALRTYFQEERDTELNRWRDPENPDMVCYAISDKNHIVVLKLNKNNKLQDSYENLQRYIRYEFKRLIKLWVLLIIKDSVEF